MVPPPDATLGEGVFRSAKNDHLGVRLTEGRAPTRLEIRLAVARRDGARRSDGAADFLNHFRASIGPPHFPPHFLSAKVLP